MHAANRFITPLREISNRVSTEREDCTAVPLQQPLYTANSPRTPYGRKRLSLNCDNFGITEAQFDRLAKDCLTDRGLEVYRVSPARRHALLSIN